MMISPRFLASSLVVLFLAGSVVRLAAQTPESDFAPVLKAAADASVLHENMEGAVSKLSGKAPVISAKLKALPRPYVEEFLGELIQFGETFPDSLAALNQGMFRLREMLVTRKLEFFDPKFTHWGIQADAVRYEANKLREIAKRLAGQDSLEVIRRGLEEASKSLANLLLDVRELRVRFSVIANLLQLFRQSGFKLTPPESRVFGETWERHVARTGHAGIANPRLVSKIFSSHSKHAIEDLNPKHDVWACEATLVDFLRGRVKGTEYPYTNSSKEAFCKRCHGFRNGKHNMRWCTPRYQDELIQACNILEKSSR